MDKVYEKKYEVKGQALIYYMPKELDQHVAAQLCKELDILVESFSVQELELDFSRTDFMDSSGIGVIIGRSKTMQYRGGKLSVSHMSRRIDMIVTSVGLQKIVEVKGEDKDEK